MPIKSKQQFKWMKINNPEMFDKWQKEHPVDYDSLPNKVDEDNIIINEQEELGLVSNKNLDDLLNNPKFHEFFKDADSFDQYISDIQEFMKQDVLSINKLKQYLQDKNYGDKSIEMTTEVLTKTEDEEKKEEGNPNQEVKNVPEEEITERTDLRTINKMLNNILREMEDMMGKK